MDAKQVKIPLGLNAEDDLRLAFDFFFICQKYLLARSFFRAPFILCPKLPIFLRLFHDLFLIFWNKQYFQEAFGYYCVDGGDVPGTLGNDIEEQMFLVLRRSNLWPIESKCLDYSEDDLFDIIEFIHDSISKPIEGWYHDYGSCGWHYTKFDRNAGKEEFRSKINVILHDYKEGFELSENGEILASIEVGLDDLVKEDLAEHDPENIDNRIDSVILKFRRYRSSQDEKT